MKVVRSGDLGSYCAKEGVRILGEGKFLVSDSFFGNERTKYCLTSKSLVQIISALTGGITDLSFDTVGYARQISNCVLTASYSCFHILLKLTLRRVMDKAKLLTDSRSLNEVSMVLLNNLLSLPFAIFLILLFDEWNYVIKANVVRMPMFWVVATASGHVLGHGKPHERSTIIQELAGNIVQMSPQKFAFNVVEKCLTFGDPSEFELLVHEMRGTVMKMSLFRCC